MSEGLVSNVEYHSWALNDDNKSENKDSFGNRDAASLPNINFHAIKYSDKSLYVWIGDASSKLENMSCSLKTPYERQPLGIDILLASTEEQNDKSDTSKDLSIKLAKRLNKQVLVSFNVANNLLDQFALQSQPVDYSMLGNSADINNNMTLMQLIERRLFSEIKAHPEKF
jgi:hypothetical protein